jgi:hypothetical protein
MVDFRESSGRSTAPAVPEQPISFGAFRLMPRTGLIDTTTGNHIWADRYEGASEDVFDLQDRITSSVVAVIEPKVRLAEIARASVWEVGHRLQDAMHYVLADLEAHVLPDSRREAIVETGPNTCLGDFATKVPHVGPSMGYARQCRTLD